MGPHPLLAAGPGPGPVFLELGAVILGLAVLARLAGRFGVSAVPLYLLGGLAFGRGGVLPLHLSEEFVRVGAEIGVVLLLFMLGLEYTGDQLRDNLRTGLPAGLADAVLNFTPGLLAGVLLGWGPLPAVLLGGVTFVTSSGIAAKMLHDLRWRKHPEAPAVLSVLVLEDLAMAVYLPLVAVLLIGQGVSAAVLGVTVALCSAGAILFVAIRFGRHFSRVLAHGSDEVMVLTVFGLVLLVAGAADRLRVSAAVGAFLVGVAISGRLAKRTHRLFDPLRHLFAAVFFLLFGLQIDPRTLPPVLLPALALAAVTAGTKVLTGWWAAGRAGVGPAARWRAGVVLVPRGEFSVVIANLGAAAEPRLGPLAAAYVLLLAVAAPVAARVLRRKLTAEGAEGAKEEKNREGPS